MAEDRADAVAGLGRDLLRSHFAIGLRDGRGALSIVDLLRYRAEIAATREWPFDAGVLRRFGLYLLIPVASWVLGALVERFVDRVLG